MPLPRPDSPLSSSCRNAFPSPTQISTRCYIPCLPSPPSTPFAAASAGYLPSPIPLGITHQKLIDRTHE
ncbi:hypothetical protein HMPREF9080_01118 [Cardiobacterium valvarum F0432]|uniref:Uncharacterized protein n=1 Tax=Cardiobacterium valvarum F0432 TaxID=797473 RepID=G9ZED3_9GAMM|nr:hypothetical protein HMPREF9080_01118 [Cardiobacterium valvarum F0432]